MNPIDNAIVLEEAKRYSDSKGGYTETKKTVLAPPTVSAWGLDGYSFPCLEVTSGMVLDITINNVTHRRIASVLETHGDNIGVAFDGGDFIYLKGTGLVYVDGATENMPDATISIVAVSETIHPIDPKFLPGVCLPVVEIADITAITAEESALLTAAIGSPIVVATDTSKIVCSYAFADDNYVFFGYTMGGNIISVDGTNWAFVTE